MGLKFNPFTGNFDWVTGAADISGGLDNLLMTDGESFLLLTSADDDVLLLT
jgi:hypothetical protein